jgi:hypothetical protein
MRFEVLKAVNIDFLNSEFVTRFLLAYLNTSVVLIAELPAGI